jgi:hypothetical protein
MSQKPNSYMPRRISPMGDRKAGGGEPEVGVQQSCGFGWYGALRRRVL